MDFFSRMFTSLFRSSTQRYKTRAEAKVRQQTIGRVQGKVLRGVANIDQKMYAAQDKILDPNKKNKGKKAVNAAANSAAPAAQMEQAETQQNQRNPRQVPQQRNTAQMQRQAQNPASMQRQIPQTTNPQAMQQRQLPPGTASPQGQPLQQRSGRPNNQQFNKANLPQAPGQPNNQPLRHGQIATRQQEKSKMGKGKQNRQQDYYMIPCANCGAEMQADWDICPYCGSMAGQISPQAPMPVAGMPQSADDRGKTIALNLDELNSTEMRHIVGWIVAQNGNHKGEDFRIYDGKNVIGTGADCDIVITDPYLSAKHCTIRHEHGNYQIMDLDSMNGTFVNGKRTRTDTIIDNDTVRFGKTEFKFKALF